MPDATSKENPTHEISELRRQIQELERQMTALRESEERYREFYDNSPLACFAVDHDGHIQDCNSRASQLTGYSKDKLLGSPILDLYADTTEGRVAAAEAFRHALAGQDIEDEVLEMRRADDTHFWISLTASTVRDSHGNAVATRALMVDITDRQVAKAALLSSERRYHLMFDLIPDGLLVLDAEGVVVDCSRSACGLYRRSRAALLGQRITDLMPSASADAAFDSLWAALRQMNPVEAETQIACGDGVILDVQRRAVPLSDERGDFAGAMINDRDISPQVLTTLALQRSEKFAQVILEASRDAIVLTDVQGNILESYKASGEDNVVGKNIFDILPPVLRESRRVHFDKVVQTAQPVVFEDENEGVILENWIYPVLDEKGQVVGLAGFTRDITERHHMREALQKSESRLQQAQAVGHVGSWEYDISTGNIWGSEEGFRIYGLPANTGQLPIDEIEAHIPDREIIHQALIDLIEHDVPYDLEFEILPHGSEERKIISSIAELVRDEDGNPQRVVGVIQDITKRKLVEQALREREARLQRVFEVLPVGLWFADKDGTLLGGNPAGVRIWGAEPLVDVSQYGVFKARRLPSREEIAPDDWALARTIREGITITDEMLEIDAFDSTKKTILNYTAPILDDDGLIQGAIVVNQDITAQVQAERALRESEARFRAIFRSSAMSMAVTDLTGRFITTNPAFRRIVGYTKDELLAMRFRDLTHPDELPADLTLFGELVSGQRQEYRREKRYIHKEGRTVPVRLTVSLMRDDEDEPQFTIGVVEDITEERWAKEALQASELRLQHITQQVPVSVWSADCDLRITYHSGSITSKQAEMLEKGQIVGHRLPDIYQTLLDPKTGQKMIGYLRRTLAGETVSYIHEPQDRQIENVISPLRDDDGEDHWHCGSGNGCHGAPAIGGSTPSIAEVRIPGHTGQWRGA